jgi:hypothetical protein
MGRSENYRPALPIGSPSSNEKSLLLLGLFAREFIRRLATRAEPVPSPLIDRIGEPGRS